MENDVRFDLVTMFNEAEKQLDRQFNSFDKLKKYSETVVGIASLIVSFFATFKVFDSSIVKTNCFYTLFICIVIVYAILMLVGIWAMKPFFINSPIEADEKNYFEAYGDKPKENIFAMQIALYAKAIQKNEHLLINQSRLTNTISVLLALMVILILFATYSLILGV